MRVGNADSILAREILEQLPRSEQVTDDSPLPLPSLVIVRANT
jgi:hypothetical protein